MKKNFLLLGMVAIAVFSGCTGAYKSTQTPDDVYYSPAKGGPAADTYEDYTASTDDNYLRMKVKDHYRWSSIDDYAYWNDSRYLSNNYYYSDFYNYNWLNNYDGASPYAGWYGYYGSWNSWYNPYYTVVFYKNPQTYKAFNTSGSNLSAYSNKSYNNINQLYPTNTKGYNNSNSTNTNTNFGSLVRKVFSSGDNNSGHSSWDTPARTFSSNNSESSSSSSPAPSSSAGGHSGGYGSSSGGTGARPSRN